MSFDGTGMKLPGSKKDNKHIGGLRPQSSSGSATKKSGRTSPLKGKK